MNRIYRLIFNRARGVVQVTSELGGRQAKAGRLHRTGRRRARLLRPPRLSPLATAVALALAVPILPASAQAAPQTLTSNTGASGVNGSSGGPGSAIAGTGAYQLDSGSTITGGNGGLGGTGGSGGAGISINAGNNLSTITNNGTINGGNGGLGGNGLGGGGLGGTGGTGGSGGSGGSGGAGISINAGNNLSTITNNGTINGGNGGGGLGGTGGAGVSGSGFTLTNTSTGTITGGGGGLGGTGVSGGSGGVGVSSTGGAKITNGGTINGGAAYGGGPVADAVDLSGGGNTLIIEAGGRFGGNVVSRSGSTNGGDTLALGGHTNSDFDIGTVGSSGQFQGFQTLEETGTATWTVTGTNGSGLGWHLNGGTLAIASASGTELGNQAVTFNGGTLLTTHAATLNQSFTLDGSGTFNNGGNADTLAGDISGNGDIILTGAGTTTLTGSDAFHSLTNDTGATANLTGAVTGNVTNNGTLAAGGATGRIRIQGNFTQGATGTLNLAVTPNASAGPGKGYDQLDITGTAQLNGALAVRVGSGTYTTGTRYDIVHAGSGVSGQFARTLYSPAFASYITPKVSYGAQDAYLTLTPTAKAFNSGQGVGVSGWATQDSLLAGMANVLNSQGGTAGQVLTVNGQPDPAVWARGLTGSGGAYGADINSHTLLIGGGTQLRPGLLIGAAFGNTDTHIDTTAQRLKTNTLGVYLYGVFDRGPLFVDGTVTGGHLKTDSTRALQALGLTAEGSASGSYEGAVLKAGYRLRPTPQLFITPYLGAGYLRTHRDAFNETGAGLLNIDYASATHNLGSFSAGARFGTHWRATPDLTLSPWLSLGGIRYVGDRGENQRVTIGATQSILPASGAPGSAGVVGAGLALMSGPNWSAQLVYHGQFSSHTHMNTGDLKVVYRW